MRRDYYLRDVWNTVQFPTNRHYRQYRHASRQRVRLALRRDAADC